MRQKLSVIAICLFVLAVFSSEFSSLSVNAQTVQTASEQEQLDQSQKDLEALKQQISGKNAEMQALQAEIDQYKKQIEQTGAQTTTLKAAIKKLEITKAKLAADIKLTQKKIEATNLAIEQLGISIGNKKDQISQGLRALQSSMQIMNELDMKSPVEVLLANENLYAGWNDFENLQRFQGGMNNQLELLKSLKRQMEENKLQSEKQKKNLTSLKSELSDQQKIVDQNKQEQNKLLTDTKNKESGYKKVLADRLAKMQKLEQEILDFEAQLKIVVDSSLLPKPGRGILGYPLNSIRITQYFGNTPFATQNPQIYNGMGHNGVDFGASPGTPVKSAEDGIVTDTGNTDMQCYGFS